MLLYQDLIKGMSVTERVKQGVAGRGKKRFSLPSLGEHICTKRREGERENTITV